ncbi:MAG TPA: glucosyl-3-phosphoglycerate synthase [Actinomycetota bacterium]|nr:glucosyl-3-phosphoglycerate synthase [Actinomycetota bacterium]
MNTHRPDPATSELPDLLRLKSERALSITVCLPALNEADTIGAICTAITTLVEAGLVDELIVVDSGSSDSTEEVARAAGASVHRATEIQIGDVNEAPGKGGSLWKSLKIARGDIIVWLDSDVRNFRTAFITALVAPLLANERIRMTKAYYERPLQDETSTLRAGGARVTELVVRPLAHLLFPELVSFVQPLSGEYAAFRDDLLDLPFFAGYGVEIGLLIDFIERHGLEAVGQVDLGSRVHRNRDTLALGRMAYEVIQVLLKRAEDLGRIKIEPEWPAEMLQFVSGPSGPVEQRYRLPAIELPPMGTVS